MTWEDIDSRRNGEEHHEGKGIMTDFSGPASMPTPEGTFPRGLFDQVASVTSIAAFVTGSHQDGMRPLWVNGAFVAFTGYHLADLQALGDRPLRKMVVEPAEPDDGY